MTDTTLPVLTSLDLPEIVDLSNGEVTVAFSAGASDAGGVYGVGIYFDRDFAHDGSTYNFINIHDNGYGWFDDQRTTTSTLLAGNAPGLVNVSQVVVSDPDGHQRTYTKSQLDALGFDTSFTISGSVADTTTPVLTSLDLPEFVDLSNGEVTVAFSAGASDAGGVYGVGIYFDRDFAHDGSTYNFINIHDNGYGWFDDQRTTTSTLLAGNAPGLVNVAQVVVSDPYGHQRTYTKSQLDALGFDTSFTISGSVADTTAPVLISLDLPEIVDLRAQPKIKLSDFSLL